MAEELKIVGRAIVEMCRALSTKFSGGNPKQAVEDMVESSATMVRTMLAGIGSDKFTKELVWKAIKVLGRI